MENVGAITFTDSFLKPKDETTARDIQMLTYVALHELSHMWFGDLVTMQWWNDLWLKESFADFCAATCLLECEALQNYKNSDLFFLAFLNQGLGADLIKSTHPISGTVNNTEDAVNVFDMISYRKGAKFVYQMRHFVGRDILTAAIKKYFDKWQFKNTQLYDFIDLLQETVDEFHAKGECPVHLIPGAIERPDQPNWTIKTWTDNWILKAGANSLITDFSQINESGTGSYKVTQGLPTHGDQTYKE